MPLAASGRILIVHAGPPKGSGLKVWGSSLGVVTMCRRPRRRMLSFVSTSTVRIAIEAHVGEDEISWQIRSDGGPPGSFSGWLGLISALDRLLSLGMGAMSTTKPEVDDADPER